MQRETHSQRILGLLTEKGILRAADLSAIGAPRVVLTRMVAAGQIERAGRGLYRLPDHSSSEHEGLVAVGRRVPQAIFCLYTALQFHELTTQLPRQVWIAMPRGSHTPRMEWPPLRMVQFSGEAYSTGVESHVRDGVQLRVYCVGKTLADCFKYRKQVGLDVALEALKDAQETRKVSADDIWRYAKTCRVTNVMRPYLEALGHS